MDLEEKINNLKTDCSFFCGDKPCVFHLEGKECECEKYTQTSQGVIIKLGAAGDVIRTTPLLRALKNKNLPKPIFVTNHSEFIDLGSAEPINPSALNINRLLVGKWDFCWNLDKDVETCSLIEKISAKKKLGFGLKNGKPFPLTKSSYHKFLTGIDNEYSKANKKSYIQEIFDIVEIPFSKEEYWIKSPKIESINKANSMFLGDDWIGLNTGAGYRWPTRLWSKNNWKKLIFLLKERNLKPLILGGPEEVELNNWLAKETNTDYFGVQDLDVFNALIGKCRLVVTSVTQAMHLAIAAQKPVIVLNNIFNKNEFELYNRGIILEPEQECRCFYSPVCKTNRNCISEISSEKVFENILKLCQK